MCYLYPVPLFQIAELFQNINNRILNLLLSDIDSILTKKSNFCKLGKHLSSQKFPRLTQNDLFEGIRVGSFVTDALSMELCVITHTFICRMFHLESVTRTVSHKRQPSIQQY